MSCGELQADDADEQQANKDEPCRRHRLVERRDAHDHRAQRTDARPDAVGRAHGQMLHKIFMDQNEVLDTVEKAILLFRSAGESGERFADTINRIGFANAEKILLSDELLQKKAEILGLDVVGGATC